MYDFINRPKGLGLDHGQLLPPIESYPKDPCSLTYHQVAGAALWNVALSTDDTSSWSKNTRRADTMATAVYVT